MDKNERGWSSGQDRLASELKEMLMVKQEWNPIEAWSLPKEEVRERDKSPRLASANRQAN
jgi:hypothetical protein